MKYVKCLFTDSRVFIKCKFSIIYIYCVLLLIATYLCSYLENQHPMDINMRP